VVLCSFIKQYLNASNADEVEHLKAELETVKQEKAQLEKELAELKVRCSPYLLWRHALDHWRSVMHCAVCTSPGTRVDACADMHAAVVRYCRAARTRRSKLVRRNLHLLPK
jgi:histidinol-phosphate/aromatic aminotransferase/cobyric acid decarboxylase-like protein